MYSPQGYTSTRTTAVVEIAVSICLKSLKSLLGGSSSDSQKQFFVARILQELFGRVVLKFNHFELKNITFNQNILFSNAVLDLDPVYMEWGTPV